MEDLKFVLPQGSVITDQSNFPIQPEDIDASSHLWDAFENMETEVSAGWVIKFLQERGKGWAEFSAEEIEAFYARKHKDGFRFNRLVKPQAVPKSLAQYFAEGLHYQGGFIPKGGGWIVLAPSGKYQVTSDFIERCHRSSPKPNPEANPTTTPASISN
ncbi:MAG: hypothetical protein G01um101420_144 [Parcubacteria group bacterium Gr01-1014_20]|nr:MAG: hypothetical protein G01um101420_144 [Parcubacteria group bacterium Gr01-1014_20]